MTGARMSPCCTATVAFLLLSLAIGVLYVQLGDHSFNTHVPHTIKTAVAAKLSAWRYGEQVTIQSGSEADQTQVSPGLGASRDQGGESKGRDELLAHMNAALAEREGMAEKCSEEYREAEYQKVKDWGNPKILQGFCEYEKCEDWTVEGMLRNFRKRGRTGFLKIVPCDLWKAIYGRTTWIVGDSQSQGFYRSIRCFLREFYADPEGKVQDEPLFTDDEHKALLKDKVFLDYGGGVGMPICTRLLGGTTRVCHIRVNFGYHFVGQYLPQLHLFGVAKTDMFVYNTGLWHHKREKNYGDIIANLTAYYNAHKADLPVFFWRDNSPQHFDIEHGEFPHPDEVGKYLTFPIKCKHLPNLTIDEQGHLSGPDQHVNAGGWRNHLSEPLIRQTDMHYIPTWNESAPLWNMHTRQENGNIECTHFCFPGPYQVWVWLWWEVLKQAQHQGSIPVPGPEIVPPGPAPER